MVEFGNRTKCKTDFFASIPNPKCIYIRLPELSMVEAMQIAIDSEALSKITYLRKAFVDCKLIAVSDENGCPKLTVSYERMEEE